MQISRSILDGPDHHLITPADYIIFSDFDETLYDHHDKNHYWFHQLEEYLAYLKTTKHINISYCILTGSNQEDASPKLEKINFKLYPDILSFGFGSEIYYKTKNQDYVEDLSWKARIKKFYNRAIIHKLIEELRAHNIILQPDLRSKNLYKESYYYFRNKYSRSNIKTIRKIAKKLQVKVIISKCNPKNGDPKNAYDIDFVAVSAGKEMVAKYIITRNQIDKHKVFAFGDSANDLCLLKNCYFGYAVSNATPQLKKYIKQLCEFDHAHGILQVLKNHFEPKKYKNL